MSLLTQCPACSTIYRVVDDQLRISEGWVKCGQCGDIFNASMHLGETQSVATPQAQPEAPVSTGSEPTIQESENAPASDKPVIAEASSLPIETELKSDPTPQLSQDDAPQDEPSVPSFLAQDTARQPFHNPLGRGLLVVATVMLSVILAGQWLYIERNYLASQHPEIRDALTLFCNLTSCTLEPLQRIESLSVDSVAFSALDKDSYRLSFVVKNSSSLALATPSVELSLTDAQDHAKYRRVFNIKEMGFGKEIAAGSERQASLALRVNSDTTETTLRGYRLLIFYP
jgi:predicted Zn finger-like uncharacterized protein